ncbi:MAG: hypothetical protein HY606_08715 [Planctomycetes bacterium]|nr:hypothetical protein [Planctomycetota bacterium]
MGGIIFLDLVTKNLSLPHYFLFEKIIVYLAFITLMASFFISGLGVLSLKPWARKLALIGIPILLSFFWFIQFLCYLQRSSSWKATFSELFLGLISQIVSTPIALLYFAISLVPSLPFIIPILIFFTRPKVKAQFSQNQNKKLNLSPLSKFFILLLILILSFLGYQHLDTPPKGRYFLQALNYVDQEEFEHVETIGRENLNVNCWTSTKDTSDCLTKDNIIRIHNKGRTVLKTLQKAIENNEIISIECLQCQGNYHDCPTLLFEEDRVECLQRKSNYSDCRHTFIFEEDLKEKFLNRITTAEYKSADMFYTTMGFEPYYLEQIWLKTKDESFYLYFNDQGFSYSHPENAGFHSSVTVRYVFNYTLADLSVFKDFCYISKD